MPPHPGTSPADSLLKKRERDRRAQQNVRNKRVAHVSSLEQRISTLENELRNAQDTCDRLRQEIKILRGCKGSPQHLVASSGDGGDAPVDLPSSHPTVHSSSLGTAAAGALSSPVVTVPSIRDESRGARKGASMTGKVQPTSAATPTSTAVAITSPSLLIPPRWNMLPAHIPERDVIVTNCFSSWMNRPDLARTSPESPQPLELLYGSKKNFLANTIYETIQQWPCREVERLACGWLTYRMIKWMVEPTEESFAHLRDFQRPTLEQLCEPHPYYADFNIWPALRSNLVKNRDVYDHMDVVGMMSCCMKVRWPWNAPFLEPNDDDLFGLKPDFYNTFINIEGWGLTQEFFDRFPLLVEGLDPSIRYEIC